MIKPVNKRSDKMSKLSVSLLVAILFGDSAEKEKGGNAKDVKTRQTCRYQNGDVSRTTSDDRKGDGGGRKGGETITMRVRNRKRGREREKKIEKEGRERETTELNKLEKHLSGQLMLLSRPLISPSPDFRRQIKALVPPGTVNTFSTPPREIMRTCTHARVAWNA